MGSLCLVSKEVFYMKFSFFKVFLGESCIWELEKRLNPPNLKDDGDLNIFIQK